jgi:hypothetical protein
MAVLGRGRNHADDRAGGKHRSPVAAAAIHASELADIARGLSVHRVQALSVIFVSIETIIENLLNPHAEQSGDLERERERGVIFPRLDRVHRLPRHVEPFAKLRLAPVGASARSIFSLVFHVRFGCPCVMLTLLCTDSLTMSIKPYIKT